MGRSTILYSKGMKYSGSAASACDIDNYLRIYKDIEFSLLFEIYMRIIYDS
jgi:hypothetical protein